MRIAHVGPSSLPIGFQYGGAVERRMLELARAQAEQRDEVAIFSIAADSPSSVAPGEFAGTVVTVRCRSRRPFRDLELPARSRTALRQFGPDVVHVHNNWSIARIFTGLGVPTTLSFDFYEYRGSGGRLGRRAYQWAIDGFDLLMPVSAYCGAGAADFWRLPGSRFATLPNGVNMTQFRPNEARRAAARAALGYRDDEVIVGYVGRICEQKGSDLLVRAYQALRAAHPATRLLVAGPTGQFGSEVTANGTTDSATDVTRDIARVGGRWLGPVPEEQLADIYRALDVFVLPTRRYEMFGMAAAEALASGTPVVCSRSGGLPEVVSEAAGVLVPPGESEALADALAALCSSPQRRAALGAAARGSVERFSWTRVADRARTLYGNVIDQADKSGTARPARQVEHHP